MNHLEDMLNTLGELEQLLGNHDHPTANPPVLAKAQQLCIRLKGTDAYIDEKAGTIEGLAAQFYSARRHQNYPGGAAALHRYIAQDLPSRIRQRIERLSQEAQR